MKIIRFVESAPRRLTLVSTVALMCLVGCLSDFPAGRTLSDAAIEAGDVAAATGGSNDGTVTDRDAQTVRDGAVIPQRDGGLSRLDRGLADRGVPARTDLGIPEMDAARPPLDRGVRAMPDMALPIDAAVVVDAARPIDRGLPLDAGPPIEEDVRCDVPGACVCRAPICTIDCESDDCENICGRMGGTCTSACSGNDCLSRCADGAQCRHACEGDRCTARCRADSVCEHRCFGNDCTTHCADGARCTVHCEGNGCLVNCADAERCEVVCRGNGCQVDCGDLDPEDCTIDCQGNGCRRIEDG